MSTRATSAVEAYNGVLGRLIPKRGNFFKFVSVLRNEEFSKSRDFKILIESGGTFGAKRSKKIYADKAKKIIEASALLQMGKITPLVFLNRMVFVKNNICTDLEPYEDIFEDEHDLSEKEDDDVAVENGESVASDGPAKCIICDDLQANTALLPCRHLKCCNECVLKMQANSLAKGLSSFHCPYCRTVVEDTIQLFV